MLILILFCYVQSCIWFLINVSWQLLTMTSSYLLLASTVYVATYGLSTLHIKHSYCPVIYKCFFTYLFIVHINHYVHLPMKVICSYYTQLIIIIITISYYQWEYYLAQYANLEGQQPKRQKILCEGIKIWVSIGTNFNRKSTH